MNRSIVHEKNDIDTQFSQDDTNREHYNLPSFVKTHIQPTDEEINRESLTTILKTLEAKTENIKHQMKSTMKAKSQTDSSTNDDRSSTCSYKGKGLNNTKLMLYNHYVIFTLHMQRMFYCH